MSELDVEVRPGLSSGHPDDIDLSIVMPCLNEARTVGLCVSKATVALRTFGLRGEVIVADNGSTDGSAEIARSLGARVIHVEQQGYGSALRAGIETARGRHVIMGDSDDSYDFSAIGLFVARFRQGHELVMGNRFQGGILPGAMPWHHRYIGNPALTGILNLFFGSPIGDAHCGLRGVSRDAFQRLRTTSTGMEFASEMVIRACLHRLKMSEVPVVLHPDGRGRPPHLRSFRDGWRHLRLLLLMCPLWLYLIPSLVLMAAGLSLMVWMTPGARPFGGVVLGLHTMLLGCLALIVGYQTFWMWACAGVYARGSGLHPSAVDAARPAGPSPLNLEQGLCFGALLVLTGLGVNGWLVWEWYQQDFGALDVRSTMRYTLWGLATMVIGVQTIYGSFFLAMLDPGRGDGGR